MEKFAGYGFNKSHSAAYAMLTYQTAWLKAHYPAAFMAAVLSSDMAHTDKVVIFVEECRRMKMRLLPPDINRSDYKFTVLGPDCILYGLGAIKGVGEAAINNIIEARQNRTFQDLFDFCARVDSRKVSRRTMEALIRSGAVDGLGEHRAALMAVLEDAILASEQLAKNRIEGQADLFGDSLSSSDIGGNVSRHITIAPYSDQLIFAGEKETLGFYFSGHPLAQFENELRALTSSTIRDLRLEGNRRVTIAGLIANVRTLNTKKGDRMAFITLDDRTGLQEVAIFSDLYRIKRDVLVKDNLVVIEGELSPDEYSGGYKMRCQQLMDIEEARSLRLKFLKIALQQDKVSEDFTQELLSNLKRAQGGRVRVRIEYQREGIASVLKLGEGWTVAPKQSLIDTLKVLCGEESVELCY